MISVVSFATIGVLGETPMMQSRLLFVLLAVVVAVSSMARADIVLTNDTNSYSQDFDTLASTGTTGTTVPAGWYFSETGTSLNTSYGVGPGSSTTGNTYSFGSAGSTERAFGGLQSGALVPTIGARFINQGSSAIDKLSVAYRGEMWRAGVTNRGAADRLDFQYSTDATSLTTGTWTGVSDLNFSSPILLAPQGALDGNAAGNFTDISSDLVVNLNPNDVIWLRWNDFNVSSSDDGLAIDNFSVTASFLAPIPEPGAMFLTGAASIAIAGRRWMRRRSNSGSR
jgi:hypothetical protein